MSTIDYAYARFCETPFPKPTEKQVQAFEQRIGVPLPAHYREFLLSHNGGYFNQSDFRSPEDDDYLDGLTVLYGLGAGPHHAELNDDGKLAISDDNDPCLILPIGYTLRGNLLILLTEPAPEDEYGIVMLKKAGLQKYLFLATDIEEFFGLLSEPSEE